MLSDLKVITNLNEVVFLNFSFHETMVLRI